MFCPLHVLANVSLLLLDMIMMLNFSSHGHVQVSESIFTYFGDYDYAFFNSNYQSFQPTFSSNRTNPPSDVFEVCGGDRDCVYDYALTQNVDLASSTYNLSVSNRASRSILSKKYNIYEYWFRETCTL